MRTTGLCLVAFLLGAGLGFWGQKHYAKTQRQSTQIAGLGAIVEEVLRLAVVESKLSQVYEVERENLKISGFPVPFTSQKTLIYVSGTASIGFDLEKSKIQVDQGTGTVNVRLGTPEVLSTDIKYEFINEEDTFLNRISVDDRNQIMANIRTRVEKDLATKEVKMRVDTRVRKLLQRISSISQYNVMPAI